VQQVLCEALATLLRMPIDLVGAGRTDAGVHARCMVAHFNTDVPIPDLAHFAAKLNSLLPYDIAIDKILEVKPTVHARFDAISRTYEYHIVSKKNVFLRHFAARFTESIDFDSMNAAAAMLLNYSDFSSFSKLHTDAKTNNCVVKRAFWAKRNEEWVFTIEADRFLRNMVRAIVGTLLDVGRGKLSVEDFCRIIEARNRCKAGVSVPAQGLYLFDIQYATDIFA